MGPGVRPGQAALAAARGATAPTLATLLPRSQDCCPSLAPDASRGGQAIVASGAIHIEAQCRWGQGERPVGPSSLIEAGFRWTFDGNTTGALE